MTVVTAARTAAIVCLATDGGPASWVFGTLEDGLSALVSIVIAGRAGVDKIVGRCSDVLEKVADMDAVDDAERLGSVEGESVRISVSVTVTEAVDVDRRSDGPEVG